MLNLFELDKYMSWNISWHGLFSLFNKYFKKLVFHYFQKYKQQIIY